MPREYIRDHCVPTGVLLSPIQNALNDKDGERLRCLLTNYCAVAYISRSEDQQLTLRRLGQKMPDDWDPDSGDLFARYRQANIEMCELPASEFQEFVPDLRGRRAELDYGRSDWTTEVVAEEIKKLFDANLKQPWIPIRAILVGFSYSKVFLSKTEKDRRNLVRT